MAPPQAPSLPSPPFLPVEGVPNFRDAGGYPVASPPGASIRRGVLFRSSEPSGVTEAGTAALQALRISKAYDLRSAVEIRRDGFRVVSWPGSERVEVPLLLDEDYAPEAVALRLRDLANGGTEGFVRVYKRILALGGLPTHPTRPFLTILRHLASPAPSPILVHCTAGKDRSGLAVAVVLSLCGVSDDVVAHEYALSNSGLAHRKEEFVAILVTTEALKGDRAGAERMISVTKEHMLAALACLRETYGSVEKYVTEYCGLTPEEVDQIRKNLVVTGEQPIDWESHADLTV